jgi:hypothetical protein
MSSWTMSQAATTSGERQAPRAATAMKTGSAMT